MPSGRPTSVGLGMSMRKPWCAVRSLERQVLNEVGSKNDNFLSDSNAPGFINLPLLKVHRFYGPSLGCSNRVRHKVCTHAAAYRVPWIGIVLSLVMDAMSALCTVCLF